MPSYHVMLLDPSNIATVFAVTDDSGTRTLVDLTDERDHDTTTTP